MTAQAKAPGKYQKLPPPTPEEREALRSLIQDDGVLSDILVDEDGEIIDGHTRQEIADELGVPCPSKVVPGKSEDEKVALAINLNWGRRNLTPEQKRNIVLDLRAEGWSTRKIANLIHISQSAVDRYIKTDTRSDAQPEPSGDPHGSPEPEQGKRPKTVRGLDDKTYPAQRPARSKSKPSADSRTSTTVEDDQERTASDRPTAGQTRLRKRAEQLLSGLDDKEVRAEVRAIAEERRVHRENLAAIRAFEKEDERREAAETKAQLAAEREVIRQAELASKRLGVQGTTGPMLWQDLVGHLHSWATLLVIYRRDIEVLGRPRPIQLEQLERRANQVAEALTALLDALHP